MSFTPNDSAIKVTKTLEQKISEASSQSEVQQILRDAAKDQHLVVSDAYDPNVLLEVPAQNQPRAFARTVTIAGQKTILTESSELELEKAVTELYKQTFQPTAATEHTDPTRDERGRFVADDPTARIESDLVARALQAQGIDPSALREFSAQREQQGWASAVEDFKEIHKDWVGGEDNKNLIGQIIIENPNEFEGLTPLQSLEKAYQYAVEQDLLVETPELQTNRKILEANSPVEILEALGRNSTSLFGR